MIVERIKNLYLAWHERRLVRRLAVPSLLISVLAVCVISGITYLVAREILRESAVTRLRLSIDLHEEAMTQWVADQKKSVIFISRASIIRDRIAELLSYPPGHPYHDDALQKISEYLFAYVKNFDGLREVMILSDRGGEVLFSTLRENEGEYRLNDTFFRRGKEGVYVQGVYPWRETAEPTITIAKPLLDANGEKRGVLAVHLNLDRLDEIVGNPAGFAQTEEVYLVDKYNSFISTERFGRKDFPRGVHSEGIDRALSVHEGSGYYENYAGIPVVGYYRWNPELEVAVLAEISQHEAFAPARQLGLFIAGAGLGLTCLLIIATAMVAHRIADPLVAMADKASEVAAGDFTIRIPVPRDDETGDLARSFNSMITRINVVHDELQKNATHFHSVFQLSPDAIGVQRAATGTFVDVNDSFCEMFGYSREEILKNDIDDLQIWQNPRDRLRFVVQLRQEGQVRNFSARFRRQNGELFPGVVSSRLIELENEAHVVSVLIDVSALQQTEAELRQSNERLLLLVDRMPIGCIAWNLDFTVSLWNPEAEKIFGFSAQEAVGTHAFGLIFPEDGRNSTEKVWQKLLAGDEKMHGESLNINRLGESIVCDWYNTPLKDDRGEVIGIISMVHDITTRKLAEARERHTAELQQIILNAIPTPIFFKDAAGVYRGCNNAFSDYIGRPVSEIVDHTVYDIAPPDKAAVYEEADNKLLQAGGIQVYEAKVRYADGSDRIVVFHKAVYRNPDGSVGGIVGNMLDVTDMHRAEQALIESEQNYREIFNASSDAIILRDLETEKVVDVNQAMLDMYGFAYHEALEASITELITAEPPEVLEQAMLKVEAAKAGTPQLFELLARRRDGSPFWVEIALKQSTILNRKCLLAVIRDIEARKRSERALIDSEERFRLLVENAADAMFLHDEQGRIISVNQRCSDRLDYSRDELLGMTIFDIEQKAGREELLKAWQAFTPGMSIAIEGRHRRKDGTTFPVDVNVVRYDSHGRKLFIALARDVSERKQQEAELDAYRNRLEDLVSERTRQLELAQSELVAKERLAVLGQLTATVSHELRNPLGTVKNAIYLLGRIKDGGDADKIGKALDLADRNVRRCDGIINELLDFTRRQELVTQPTDLGRLLQSILDEQALPGDIAVETVVLPDVVVSIDPERMRRVFVNVLSNAVQALDGAPGQVKRISIRLERAAGRVKVEFADSGPGISADILPRIFEPMFSTKNFGVGLGMAIVRNIMQEHGGDVEVASRPGEGAVVTLWLPDAMNASADG